MITHRCKGSLADRVSIRWERQFPGLNWHLDILDNDFAWRLFKHHYAYEYGAYVPLHIAKIKYCPFCGKLLEEIDDERNKSDYVRV